MQEYPVFHLLTLFSTWIDMSLRLLALLLFCGSFFTGQAQAATCAQNGGTTLGCVEISGVIFKDANDNYHETALGAAQGNVARYLALSPGNADIYDYGLQTGPVNYTRYPWCNTPTQEVDNTFTDFSNPNFNGSGSIYFFTIHIYGTEVTSPCNKEQHFSAQAWSIGAHPVCPHG
jgi:hypothetical protein